MADGTADRLDGRERGESAGAATRAGFVALLGAPNAGKSTLVNALVGAKVSIVTHKVQTTRGTVRGILLHGDAQIVLVDLPGVFAPTRPLERAMVNEALARAREADVLACLVDARRGLDREVEAVLGRAGEVRAPRLLVLTKIDVVDKPRLLELAAAVNTRHAFDRTMMISAETGSGLDDLKDRLAAMMPPGPWLYPEDQISDLPMRRLAAEITREHLTRRLHQELPYALTVETDAWTEHPDGSVRIDQTIIAERDSHKKIIIGRGGQTLKAVSTAARTEIAALVGAPVHLFVFVKIRGNWQDAPDRYRAMNLDFPGRSRR